MSERWKTPEEQPSIRHSVWAKFVEYRGDGAAFGDPGDAQLSPQQLSDSAISDLEMDGMLRKSTEIDDRAGTQPFIDSVMNSIETGETETGEIESGEIEYEVEALPDPAIKPFKMFDRCLPDEIWVDEHNEYEILESMTEPPSENGGMPHQNGHGQLPTELTSPESKSGETVRNQLAVPRPSIAEKNSRSRKPEFATPTRSPEPASASNETLGPDQKLRTIETSSRARTKRWTNVRVLAAISAVVLFVLGIGVGYIVLDQLNSAAGGSLSQDGTQGDEEKNAADDKTSDFLVDKKNKHPDRDRKSDPESNLPGPNGIERSPKKSVVDNSHPSKSNPVKDQQDAKLPNRDQQQPAIVKKDSDRKQKDSVVKHDPSRSVQSSGLGTIVSDLDATKWTVLPSKILGTDELELNEGSVKIEMHNGAKLTLSSPAKFQLVSGSLVFLKSGTISATVSEQAKGFAVQTPTTKIVDLGTRFEVTVDDDKASRVYVSEGLVEVAARSKKDGDVQKWQQKAGQSSGISGDGQPVEWLLSIQFDRNGFGQIEFNGKVLDEVIFADNAEFVLQNIVHGVLPKVRLAERHLESPMRGAIVIDSETIVFENATQFQAAYTQAIRIIRDMKFEQLDILAFANARQRFMEQRNEFLKQINMLDPRNIQNPNKTGNNGMNFRLPTANSVITIASSNSQDIAKLISDQTVAILEEKRKKAPQRKSAPRRKNRRQRANDRRQQAQNLFPRNINMGGFGSFTVDGLLGNPNDADSEMPDLQSQREIVLKQKLFDNVAEVDLFRNLDESRKSIEYVRNLNATAMRTANLQGDPTRDDLVEPIKDILPLRPDLSGLPFTMGDDCILDPKKSQSLAAVSNFLGTTISTFNRFGSLPGADNRENPWRDAMLSRAVDQCCRQNGRKKSVPGLVQMLQADHPRVRYHLVKQLEKAGGIEAAVALAQRAKYDLNPEIRAAAADALKDVPADHYQQTLLDGFDYPWPAVAKHSAEALVRIADTSVVDELAERVDNPNPTKPYENEKGKLEVREVVAINHMRNCLLCHAPSRRTDDPVRGNVPSPGERLPQQYYQSMQGAFVRADVTYIRQDFSVVQPVEDHGDWPKMQRYDYVVRKRDLTPAEQQRFHQEKKVGPNPYRASLVFALQQLTGKKAKRDSAHEWQKTVREFHADKAKPKPQEKELPDPK